MSTSDVRTAIELLKQDTLSNLMTLKMLTLYPDACAVRVWKDAAGWAALTLLDARASHWDRRAYSGCSTVAFVDGISQPMLRVALDAAPRSRTVFKVHDEWTKRELDGAPDLRRVAAFISFTAPPAFTVTVPPANRVESSDTFSEQSAAYFAMNGYHTDELHEHFARGARWFGYSESGRLLSVCLVFQNYADVWEIGGVYTTPDARRRGLGTTVVSVALEYLLRERRIPRYQFSAENAASRALAVSLGMTEFLRVAHYASAAA